MEADTSGWLAAQGGRCYREKEVREAFQKMRLCPACEADKWSSWKKNMDAYEAHYNAVHRK